MCTYYAYMRLLQGKQRNHRSTIVETKRCRGNEILSNFISDQGKILPRRVTGLNSKQQKRITKLIKRARIAALLPFVIGKA